MRDITVDRPVDQSHFECNVCPWKSHLKRKMLHFNLTQYTEITHSVSPRFKHKSTIGEADGIEARCTCGYAASVVPRAVPRETIDPAGTCAALPTRRYRQGRGPAWPPLLPGGAMTRFFDHCVIDRSISLLTDLRFQLL